MSGFNEKTQVTCCMVGLLLQNFRDVWEPGSSGMTWAFSHPQEHDTTEARGASGH